MPKELTKEQINALLRRPIQDGKKYDHLIAKPLHEKTNLGNGNTFHGVAMIKKYVLTHYKQVAKLAPVLLGNSLEQTTKNVHSFLCNNIQYQIDYVLQHVRSPANSWANRAAGIECKNYSLFTSAILKNLGIKHYIRQVKQAHFKPEQYTHVYVVVPKDQESANLDHGYYVIDATNLDNRESSINQKSDVLMKDQLPYQGLNAAAPKKRVVRKKPVKKTVPKTTRTKKGFPFN